jgi:hypothetical protein
LIVSCLAFFITTSSEATTWYVKADPSHSGNGTKNRPFSTLQEAEGASLPGDTILILQSKDPLDGGIQLKDGQSLIGLGPSVTRANPNSARAMITNTNPLRYDGDRDPPGQEQSRPEHPHRQREPLIYPGNQRRGSATSRQLDDQ